MSTVTAPSDVTFLREQESDDELLSMARSGNQRAFGELCVRYMAMLRQRIFRIVRHWEDTEDVLQETLLSAYQHLPSFRGTCKFSTWMTKIGINTSLMLLRKRKTLSGRLPNKSVDDGQGFEMEELQDPRENPEEIYVAAQTLLRVRKAMRNLPPSARTLMDLYYRQEIRLKDAATVLGITEATAKSRLLRGRNRIRRSLSTKRIPDPATIRRRDNFPLVRRTTRLAEYPMLRAE